MRITEASGTGQCGICGNIIAEGTNQIVGKIGKGKYEGRYHIKPTDNCKGFVEHHWEFVDVLVSSMTEEQLIRLGVVVAMPDDYANFPHVQMREEMPSR